VASVAEDEMTAQKQEDQPAAPRARSDFAFRVSDFGFHFFSVSSKKPIM
jgi:hypothetical protein